MTHIRYVSVKIASLLGILLVLSVLLFSLQEWSGADPVAATMGSSASAEAIAAERARQGLDAPVVERYFQYLGGLVTGDLGTSFRTRQPVVEDLAQYLPGTLELVGFAFVLAVIMGVIFALSSVLRVPGFSIFRAGLFLGSTAPTFLIAIVGLLIFYRGLGWLPVHGRGVPDGWGATGFFTLDSLLAGDLGLLGVAIQHLILPATALAVGPAIAIGRILRASLVTTLNSDFVRTATSKGLTERQVLTRHVMRNSLNAVLSMSALQLGFMFGGVLIVETVFSWGGVGSYLSASLPVSDFPAIAGVTFILGALYVIVNTMADILQSVADPRISVN